MKNIFNEQQVHFPIDIYLAKTKGVLFNRMYEFNSNHSISIYEIKGNRMYRIQEGKKRSKILSYLKRILIYYVYRFTPFHTLSAIWKLRKRPCLLRRAESIRQTKDQ